MALLRDGIAAFLEAVGIAAVLWVLFDWIIRPRPAMNEPVTLSLSGDAGALDAALRRLEGLPVILLDDGLSDTGRRRANSAAASRPNTTLMKREETHGGTQYH